MLDEIGLLEMKLKGVVQEVEKAAEIIKIESKKMSVLENRCREWKYMYHDKDLEVTVCLEKLGLNEAKLKELREKNDDYHIRVQYLHEH